MSASAGPPEKRTLLVIAGGREAVPIIAEARRMGLRVVVSDGAPDAPGFRFADAGLLANTYDIDGTVEAARAYAARTPLSGVMCAAADVPMTVAGVAHALGLPGLSLESARLSSDKLAMKECLRAAGVRVPWFAPVDSADELIRLATRAGRPLIVKPVDSRGARGVIRLLRGVDPGWAYGVAAAESPTGRVMVEEFVAGPQLSTESAVIQGTTYTVGYSDRNYEFLDRFAPFVIENGGELPSAQPDTVLSEVDALVGSAAHALGIARGTVKGDIVIGPDGPVVIEIAARLSGGYFCSHEIPLATGVDFVNLAIRLALGEDPDASELKPRWSQGVAQRFIFPAPGEVKSVQGVSEAAVGEGIALLEVAVGPGYRVRPMTSHVCRGGVVIAVGETREQATARAMAAAARVRIVTGAPSTGTGAHLH